MSTSPYIADVNQDSFTTEVLDRSQQVPVLVDFWADWCNPCKMLMPLLANLTEEYQGKFFLAKVNTDVERGLAEQYTVRSLPTVKIFRFGEVVDEFSGVIPENEIRLLVDNYIERESDIFYSEAMNALENGNIELAKEKMQRALEKDPERKNIILGMAEVYIRDGAISEAEALLHHLPINMQSDEDVESMNARLMFAAGIIGAPDIDTLEQSIESNPKDCDSLYQLGSSYATQGDYEKALETFLSLMTVDKKYREGTPRKAMLAIFNILGSGPLVNMYRSKMASALL